MEEIVSALGETCVGVWDGMPAHTPRDAVLDAAQQAACVCGAFYAGEMPTQWSTRASDVNELYAGGACFGASVGGYHHRPCVKSPCVPCSCPPHKNLAASTQIYTILQV